MTKYAQAALLAAKTAQGGTNAALAWEEATIKIFGKGTASQKKGCPKGAFLGLCEEGLVEGVDAGTYLANGAKNKSKRYALAALELLKKERSIPENRNAFWQRVPGTPNAHNGQLDVLFALVEEGFINR
jgi:hypothetical protein